MLPKISDGSGVLGAAAPFTVFDEATAPAASATPVRKSLLAIVIRQALATGVQGCEFPVMRLLKQNHTPDRSRSYFRVLLLAAASLLQGHVCLAESIVESRDGGAFTHIRALQEIATANGGNRAAGTPGYDRSAEYVAERLRAGGYKVHFEEFTFPFFEERAPPVVATTPPGGDLMPLGSGAIRTLSQSGSGDLNATLRPVDLGLAESGSPDPSTSGCEVSDFAAFERGAIALVRRGTCPFQVKVENATAAGAVGVIIMNEGTKDRTGIFAGRLTSQASVPVVGTTYEAGRSLASAANHDGGVSVRLAVAVLTGTRTTRNVLAELEGDPARTIILGAHLDSVAEGPGINDNASGAAAVLEAALRSAELPVGPGPRVRFAFWGAEEQGLIGSRHHVRTLSEEERRAIALYINLDMVGSSNFGRFVQVAEEAPESPAAVARETLVSYFRDRNLPVEERVRGRRRGFGSDDASFTEKGIPSIGLYTGAGETKGEAQAALFGGVADRPFDGCYHKACDTDQNIDKSVLEQMSAALVHALMTLRR